MSVFKYTCGVDLKCKVYSFSLNVPVDPVVWSNLLTACGIRYSTER